MVTGRDQLLEAYLDHWLGIQKEVLKKGTYSMYHRYLTNSDISVTLGVYSHVLPTMHKQAMDHLDVLFGNPQEKENQEGNTQEKDHQV